MPAAAKVNITMPTIRSPSKITYPTALDRRQFKRENGKDVTDFQWKVYDALSQIPSGKITTYRDLALHLKTSPRALGGALRNNPFCPLIPCHRVIDSSGKIGGFFGQTGLGGAVDKKVDLLKEEGIPLKKKMLASETVVLLEKKDMQERLWIFR